MAREKRDNNFNIIRFVAAIMVMAGHMAYIGGYTLPTLWGEGIQALGVKIFFLIGGFLIAKSWESDSNPVRYMTKRVFRIFPAAYCIYISCCLCDWTNPVNTYNQRIFSVTTG